MRSEEELFVDGKFTGYTDTELVELRELFVRNRFAEKQWFGRHDIEEWFAERRHKRIEESDAHIWEGLLGCINRIPNGFEESSLGTLRKYGARYPFDISTFPTMFRSNSAIRVAIQRLSNAEWDTFLGNDTDAVVCALRTSKSSITFEAGMGKGGVWGDELDDLVVVSSIFLAREFGQGRRDLDADKFIRRTLGRCIAHVRADAERDFAQAHAVSPDGKIVTVDRVVALYIRDGLRVSTEFPIGRINKPLILKEHQTLRIFNGYELSGVMSDFFDRYSPQALVLLGKEKILLTSGRFMPPM